MWSAGDEKPRRWSEVRDEKRLGGKGREGLYSGIGY
jgi:hypothetical protein